MNTEVSPEFFWIAVAIVTVLSASRLTRLLAVDDFPPIAVPRQWLNDWLTKTERRLLWEPITWCGYCISFWPTLAVVLSGYYSDWHDAWWLVNGALAASYLAVTYVTHDGDDD